MPTHIDVSVGPSSVFAETCSARPSAGRASGIAVDTKDYITVGSGGQFRKSVGRQSVTVRINPGYFSAIIHLGTGLTRCPQPEADPTGDAIASGEPPTYRQINSFLIRTKRRDRTHGPQD